jgi:hypothetical protein
MDQAHKTYEEGFFMRLQEVFPSTVYMAIKDRWYGPDYHIPELGQYFEYMHVSPWRKHMGFPSEIFFTIKIPARKVKSLDKVAWDLLIVEETDQLDNSLIHIYDQEALLKTPIHEDETPWGIEEFVWMLPQEALFNGDWTTLKYWLKERYPNAS